MSRIRPAWTRIIVPFSQLRAGLSEEKYVETPAPGCDALLVSTPSFVLPNWGWPCSCPNGGRNDGKCEGCVLIVDPEWLRGDRSGTGGVVDPGSGGGAGGTAGVWTGDGNGERGGTPGGCGCEGGKGGGGAGDQITLLGGFA